MGDKPILFSAPMIRAMLDGRKTQTRRVLKGAWQGALEGHDHIKTWFAPLHIPREGIANQWAQSGIWAEKHGPRGYNRFLGFAPYRPGDRLWVREAWQEFLASEFPPGRAVGMRGRFGIPAERVKGNVSYVAYRADGDFPPHPEDGKAVWRSPIHMPRRASRLTLIVEAVKVERLQDISEEDAIAEGVEEVVAWEGVRRFKVYGKGAENLACPYGARISFSTLWDSINGPGAWEANPWVCALTFRVEQRNIDTLTGGRENG